MTPEETRQLSNLLATRFIQRKDVFAKQTSNGGYMPVTKGTKDDTSYVPFSRSVLEAHLAGTTTVGHYLLDAENNTKVIAIDVDLAKAGWVPTLAYDPILIADNDQYEWANWLNSFTFVSDLRATWHDRKQAGARQYLKGQMRQLAGIFAASMHSVLEVDVAATYTGNKGVHVYGLPGTLPAEHARAAAELVLSSLEWPEVFRGNIFWRDRRGPHIEYDDQNNAIPAPFPSDGDPGHFFNFHFEVFPKQGSLEGKKLGNLMRLPLGVNQHHKSDPTFFIDLTSPLRDLRPVDPIWALTTSNPWGDVKPAA